MRIRLFYGFFMALSAIFVSCKPKVNPCNCAKNLLKSEKDFDADLDERCDAYLEALNEKKAQKWSDSMMNCVTDKN